MIDLFYLWDVRVQTFYGVAADDVDEGDGQGSKGDDDELHGDVGCFKILFVSRRSAVLPDDQIVLQYLAIYSNKYLCQSEPRTFPRTKYCQVF